MDAPLSEFEAQVALAKMILKLLANEDSTKPRVSFLCDRPDRPTDRPTVAFVYHLLTATRPALTFCTTNTREYSTNGVEFPGLMIFLKRTVQ